MTTSNISEIKKNIPINWTKKQIELLGDIFCYLDALLLDCYRENNEEKIKAITEILTIKFTIYAQMKH